MKLHFKTRWDYFRVKLLEKIISYCKGYIRKIEKECEHLDTIPKLKETMAFEYTAVNSCVLCGLSPNRNVSQEDKEKLLREFFDNDIELITREIYDDLMIRGGFNLEYKQRLT